MVSTRLGSMLPQEFHRALGPLLFLIYINDLSNELSSNCKLFGDDKSRFSIVNNIHTSAITNWAFQWKIYLILI